MADRGSRRNLPRQRSQSRSMHLCQRCNASKSRVFIFQYMAYSICAPVWVVWACSDARNAITFAFIKRWLLLHRRLGMGWYGMFRGGSGWDGDSREVLVSNSNSDCSENCDCCWRQMWVTFAGLGNKKWAPKRRTRALQRSYKCSFRLFI